MRSFYRPRPFAHLFTNLCPIAIACILLALPAYSQQPQLDALAAQAAQAIEKAHAKSVVVLDFSGPGLKVTQLGRDLADQFSAALSAASSGKFKVLDRSRLDDFIQKQNLSILARGFASAAFPGDKFGAKAVISGELSVVPADSSPKLELHCLKTGSRPKKIAELQAELPQTAQTKISLLTVVPGTDFSKYAEPGKNGVTLPGCERCPPPDYTNKAFRDKVQGVVLLGAVITREGNADGLIVLKGLPDGLTDSALKEVARWKFKPSLGPDGSPMTIWTLIEVDFHIR